MHETKLINASGQPQFGYFETTPQVINTGDFDYRSPMGGRRSRVRKWLDYNQFQYIGVISDDLLLGCALGDFRYLGIVFVYTYEPATGHLEEFEMKVPLGHGISLTNRPLDGTSTVETGGNSIAIVADSASRGVSLKVNLKSGLAADVHFTLDGPKPLQPMSVCTQTAKTGWVFTQKVAGVRAAGTVTGPFGTKDLAEINACAHYDYSVGYMRHETFWNWACFSGTVDDSVVGLNVSCGVNETSFSENCIWIDGELIPVGLTRFDYDRRSASVTQWTVRSADGAVDLEFVPEGTHAERLNLLVVASDFKQIFGKFNGVLRPPSRPAIQIRDQYGFVEDQYAKW